MKYFIMVLLSVFLFGSIYTYSGEKVVVKTWTTRYQLLSYNPPKHFYVDVKNLETGEIKKEFYVSKRCDNHHNLVVGGIYVVEGYSYYYKNYPNDLYTKENYYDTFCK